MGAAAALFRQPQTLLGENRPEDFTNSAPIMQIIPQNFQNVTAEQPVPHLIPPCLVGAVIGQECFSHNEEQCFGGGQ